MNRRASTLLSLGISIALIAGTIWFLFNHHNSFGFGNGRWMMPHHMTFGGGGMGILMILFWVAVIAAFVMVIMAIVSNGKPPEISGNRKNTDALNILKARYARGEIDKGQYQTMRRELEKS
jgi:putative membrane protein